MSPLVPSLPVPLIDKSTTMGVKQSPGTTMTTIQSAFKLYQPVKELRGMYVRYVCNQWQLGCDGRGWVGGGGGSVVSNWSK